MVIVNKKKNVCSDFKRVLKLKLSFQKIKDYIRGNKFNLAFTLWVA